MKYVLPALYLVVVLASVILMLAETHSIQAPTPLAPLIPAVLTAPWSFFLAASERPESMGTIILYIMAGAFINAGLFHLGAIGLAALGKRK